MTARQKACEGCATLTAEVEALRRERDEALTQLAREREKLNALHFTPEAPVPNYPASAGVGPPPLRYRLVDLANEQVKRYLSPLHGGAKSLLKRRTP